MGSALVRAVPVAAEDVGEVVGHAEELAEVDAALGGREAKVVHRADGHLDAVLVVRRNHHLGACARDLLRGDGGRVRTPVAHSKRSMLLQHGTLNPRRGDDKQTEGTDGQGAHTPG